MTEPLRIKRLTIEPGVPLKPAVFRGERKPIFPDLVDVLRQLTPGDSVQIPADHPLMTSRPKHEATIYVHAAYRRLYPDAPADQRPKVSVRTMGENGGMRVWRIQ